MSDAPTIKMFNPDHWPMRLDVPVGLRYVDTDDVEEMRDALNRGLGVFTSSCGGHIFLWRDLRTRTFRVNHFFQGPPTAHEYDSAEQALAFATRCTM